MTSRQSLLAKAHLAAKDLCLDDDTRRAVQLQIGGRESCKDMSTGQLLELLRHYQALGWQPKPARGAKARVLASAPQHKKIRALWLALADAGVVKNRDETALRRYVERQTGVGALQWLTPDQASRAIESLKKWCQRERVEVQE